MSNSKPLYNGKFVYCGQHMEDWVRAESKAQAYIFLTARLAIEIGTTSYSVRNYFKSRPTQYTIEEVQEDGKR